jgi:hypothetical protein
MCRGIVAADRMIETGRDHFVATHEDRADRHFAQGASLFRCGLRKRHETAIPLANGCRNEVSFWRH